MCGAHPKLRNDMHSKEYKSKSIKPTVRVQLLNVRAKTEETKIQADEWVSFDEMFPGICYEEK